MTKRTPRASRGSALTVAFSAGLIVLVVAVVWGLTAATGTGTPERTPSPQAAGSATVADAGLGAPVPGALLIRPDSHRLGPPAGDRVRFVEFLDLECEACRAAFPSVERLRAEYAGRVDFVARYFPLPSHTNAEAAALATEAAARQGRFEAMYRLMYETQAEWGDQSVPHAATFRGFAQRLGLDMTAFDRDVADPAVRSRVRADVLDGAAAGVRATPTMFINDRPVDGERSYAALRAALDDALAP